MFLNINNPNFLLCWLGILNSMVLGSVFAIMPVNSYYTLGICKLPLVNQIPVDGCFAGYIM